MYEDTASFVDPEGEPIKAFVIEFPSKYKIYALSSNPANMRGMQGYVCIDEAAHQKDLPGLMKAAMAMLMWGGKVRIISTHHGEGNPFNKLVKDINRGYLKFSHHKFDIERALADGMYKRICEVTGETWTPEGEKLWLEELVASYGAAAAEELYCSPSSLSGQFFNREVVEAAVRKEAAVLRFVCSQKFIGMPKTEQTAVVDNWLASSVAPHVQTIFLKNYKTYAGLDFGRSHDLSVLTILVEDYAGVRWVPLMLELRNTPFHCQAQIVRYVFSKFRKFRKAAFDATGNGSYLAEEMALDFGGKIEQVKLNAGEYLARFPRYKSALEVGDLTIPDDDDIVDDHLSVVLVDGVPKVPAGADFRGSDNLPRHGDAAISLMLAWSATPERKKSKPRQLGSYSYYDFGLG